MDPFPQFETAQAAIFEIQGKFKPLKEVLYSLIDLDLAVSVETENPIYPLCGAYAASPTIDIGATVSNQACMLPGGLLECYNDLSQP